MTESPLVDLDFAVLLFSLGDDSTACFNKAMAFLIVVASSRFAPTNNQLRTSSNTRNQAAIQDGRVTVKQVQGRQGKAMAFLSAVASRFLPLNNQLRTSSNPRNQATIQDGEGHMLRQCTQPKRPRNSAWFKEKLMLAEAQEASQILDEEKLAFLADPDCDDLSSAKAVLMANLSSCDHEVLLKVPYFDSYLTDMINQDVKEMQYSEQTHVGDFQDNKIHSDCNIISYSQYLQES
nr:hypothetical protein [Tanacetum cinerariifolium]